METPTVEQTLKNPFIMASYEHDSSDEQKRIAGEEDEDDDDDDNSWSDSQSSTDDVDEDDSIWSGVRYLSWTSKLLSTFNEAKKEFQNQGMTADDAHQEAYQCVLPKLRRNIISSYVPKIADAAKLHKILFINRSWAPNERYKKIAIMNLKKPWDMQLKKENISLKRYRHPE